MDTAAGDIAVYGMNVAAARDCAGEGVGVLDGNAVEVNGHAAGKALESGAYTGTGRESDICLPRFAQ